MANTKTAKEWFETDDYSHITLMDPDGWDRKTFREDFVTEQITKEELDKRLMTSTCMFGKKK